MTDLHLIWYRSLDCARADTLYGHDQLTGPLWRFLCSDKDALWELLTGTRSLWLYRYPGPDLEVPNPVYWTAYETVTLEEGRIYPEGWFAAYSGFQFVTPAPQQPLTDPACRVLLRRLTRAANGQGRFQLDLRVGP